VAAGGYAWWYVDALSDDGQHGLTLIAFIGSVFSPYYAAARRRGAADPRRHCALNVALYGPRAQRWAMTERGAGALRRDATCLSIGPSALHWDGEVLTAEIDEWTVPWPSRLRGVVRIYPQGLNGHDHALDRDGHHRWHPIAPCARVEVELRQPALRWAGPGYLDANQGDTPLESAFRRWDWSRAALPGGGTAVIYDAERCDGGRTTLALDFDARGGVRAFAPPPPQALPPTLWGVERGTRSEGAAHVLRTLEDTPFYARSLVDAAWAGQRAVAVHESLSLERFSRRWVQALLPFRMPRRG
jgi:carotenoid 1,2-hydratase